MYCKICGLTQKENIQHILTLRPDYIGFIFYKNSKRYCLGQDLLNSKHFAEIKEECLRINAEQHNNDSIRTKMVGVFVREDLQTLCKYVQGFHLDVIQLHGDEEVEYLERLKAVFPEKELWKVVRVDDDFNFGLHKEYFPFCHKILFDTKTKDDTVSYGGTGKSFTWDLLKDFQDKDFFLSGGVGLHNIDKALSFAVNNRSCVGLDLNSKFEISPGVKDLHILKSAIKQIRK
jgi:phosphoribosylanthranilate isomerase